MEETGTAGAPPGREGVGVWILLMLFGLLFLSIGIAGKTFYERETEGWVESSAVLTITRHGGHGTAGFSVGASYEYGGKRYENISPRYKSTSMRDGQRVTILINPENPEKIRMSLERIHPASLWDMAMRQNADGEIRSS